MAKLSSAPGVLHTAPGAATSTSSSDSGVGDRSAVLVGRSGVSELPPERSFSLSMLIGIVGLALIVAAFYVAGIGVR